MNFEFFIARGLIKQKGNNFSKPIVKIATVSIALSIAVMIISIAVLGGFKNEIKHKITGFTSHIHILPYSLDVNESSDAFSLGDSEKQSVLSHPNTLHIEPYILQAGAIKTKESFQGVVMKGVENDYDSTFFKSNLKEGRLPDFSKATSTEVLVSKTIADKMKIGLGDKIRVYFYIGQTYRVRPFTVVGIYETGLGDYDQKFLLASAKVFQKLNKWGSDQYSGYEVRLKDFKKLNQTAKELYATLPHDTTVSTIEEIEPGLFAWLKLLDSNVVMILIVMTLVTITATCSTLLIMVFEQTSYIGLLKSLGAKTRSITKIFLYKAMYIIGKAVIYGNIFAILLCFIQTKYRIIRLDQDSYYLDSVPMQLNVWSVLAVNVGLIIVSMAALLIPARSIGNVSPVLSIRKS
ncbi:MAG: ABC transporter permease [Bacteroidales bacterium]|nr:ABC transporter permease [Bacteroidales bacterium]